VYSEFLLGKAERSAATDQAMVLEPRDIEKLRRIHLSAQRISTFAKELVQYARPAREEPTAVDINSIVMQAIGFCEHLFERTDIALIESLTSDLPEVFAVPGQLEQVLINLITNASQAVGSRGTVHLRTSCPEPGYVAFSVADDGPGIPADRRDSVFEPFFTTKSDGQGTGLGLSIVRNIIEQHAGTIEVGEAREGGALFTVRLPTRRPG
jgi:signal transduction histidine kinase